MSDMLAVGSLVILVAAVLVAMFKLPPEVHHLVVANGILIAVAFIYSAGVIFMGLMGSVKKV